MYLVSMLSCIKGDMPITIFSNKEKQGNFLGKYGIWELSARKCTKNPIDDLNAKQPPVAFL